MRQRADGARAGKRGRRRRRWAIAGAALAVAVAAVLVFEPSLLPPPPARPSQPAAGGARIQATPFFWPGIRQPATLRADQSELGDDEEVIGVSAGNRHRAYRVAAFRGMTALVVNDVLAGEPVTVTVCEQDGCVRVFTGDRRGEPLDVWMGGFVDGMLLRVNNEMYRQSNSEPFVSGAKRFPYRQRDFERTAWHSWRAKHPDTDAYVGPPSDPQRPMLDWELKEEDDKGPTPVPAKRPSPSQAPRE